MPTHDEFEPHIIWRRIGGHEMYTNPSPILPHLYVSVKRWRMRRLVP